MPDTPANRRSNLFGPRDLSDRQNLLRFVQTGTFQAAWKHLGLQDGDLRALEFEVLSFPDKPPVVSGTGGVRKVRFAPPSWHTGKSGAIRAYFAYFPEHGVVLWVFAHDKESMDEIPDDRRKPIRLIVEDIQRYLDEQR